jgi:hypothetical protein
MTDSSSSPTTSGVASIRRFSDDGSRILERLEGSALLNSGQVNLIVLDSIAESFGSRWEAKRVAVYEHVERVLARSAAEAGYFARVSETDFLVVHPDLGEFSAQASCHRAFQEIWKYFLGQTLQPNLTVHRVTDLSQQQITAVPTSLTDALAGEAREMNLAACRGAEDRSIISPSRWSPFVATDGRKVGVSCSLEPIYNLKTQSRIGFRIRRKVTDLDREVRLSSAQVAALSRLDLLRIDMATVAHGLARLETEASDSPELILIVPVSYISVSHQQSRQVIAEALGVVRKAVLAGIICEIRDAEHVPQGALLETVSLLRPWSLLVAAYVREAPTESMKYAGLQAISMSCPEHISGDAEFLGWLKSMLRAGKHIARSVMVYRCGSARRLAIAGVLGATHGSMGVFAQECGIADAFVSKLLTGVGGV